MGKSEPKFSSFNEKREQKNPRKILRFFFSFFKCRGRDLIEYAKLKEREENWGTPSVNFLENCITYLKM